MEVPGSLLKQNPLFVFALPEESAGEFNDVDTAIVGVGKAQAIYNLLKRIHKKRPGIIVNVGSAGSSHFKAGEVVCCTQFIQRDMDVTALNFEKYQTPFSAIDPIIQYGYEVPHLPKGICGSGDNFEVSHNATDYNVVDMEAYPLAWVAMQESIPFLCLKYISDGANGQAAQDWNVAVHLAAAALRKTVNALL